MGIPALKDGYRLRRATRDDADFVLDLFSLPHVVAQLHAPSKDRYLAALERDAAEILILEREGEPLGNVALQIDMPWLMTISTIAIAKPGMGAGKALLDGLLEYAFDVLGLHRVFLEVRAGNDHARRLYESVGFLCEGRYRHGFRDADGNFHDLLPYGLLATDPRG